MSLLTKRVDCFYGPPHSGKTSAILKLIEQLHYEDPTKIARIYVGDGSLGNYLDSGLIEAGLCAVFDYSGRKMPLSVTEQICEGYWAADPLDADSPLITLSVDEIKRTGLWIFEGLSVMGSYIMSNIEGGLAWRSARGEKIGQDSPIMIKDGKDRVYGGNPMSHYNVTQRHMWGCLQRTKRLPGMVLWSAHERESEDKLQGEMIVAPEIAGRAMSGTIAREFANTLHFTTATTVKKVKDPLTERMVTVEEPEYRMYTRDHFDPDGRYSTKYRAGVRTMAPDRIKPYYVAPFGKPGQYILEFYADLQTAKREYLEAFAKRD